MNFFSNHFHRGDKVALTHDQMRAIAPSIFAEQAHESRSDRYTYIPTIDVLAGLENEGFRAFSVQQAKCRSADRYEFTKHLIRLRHETQLSGTDVNEIVLVNSHDGSSSYKMMAGQYRLVCENGLICGTTLQDFRIRHTGNVIDNVIEGAYEVLNQFGEVVEQRETMKGIALNAGEELAFATAALALRYDEAHIGIAPIKADQLLRAQRHEDRKADLWTTFNRVQENVIRGGLRGRTANGNRTTTRAVNGIDQNVALNRGLWTLAHELAKLKTAA